MSNLRSLAAMLAAMLLVLAVATPAHAAQWSILDCEFSGSNALYSGNLAYAQTKDDNGRCTVDVKLKYKVDGFWYTKAMKSDGYLASDSHNGADDAAGQHRGWTMYGVSSGWKYTS